MQRFFIIVLDGVGAGGAPDASDYGDEGANTLGNLARAEGGLDLPVMGSMGLGNIITIAGVPSVETPTASWGLMRERSRGKDTITGHWEMMGIVTDVPFPTYPQGFPDEIKTAFEKAVGRRALWNGPRSGTEVVEEQGDEHVKTGRPIVYTSADSVFQIAAHEDVMPVEELYDICLKARGLLVPPHNICRVIARPFIGPPYERTPQRKDFPLEPPEECVIDLLAQGDIPVVSVGKVYDMFGGRGFSGGRKTLSNRDGMDKIEALEAEMDAGLVFANLVDFDTLWGHRNDTAGFRRGLEDFDRWLGEFLTKLGGDDHLAVTADHGLDPTTPSTDHSREQVPILFHSKGQKPRGLGIRETFMDLGASVAQVFGIRENIRGRSFLQG
jgi:phosphopentomutase